MSGGLEHLARFTKTVAGKDKFMRTLQFYFKILGEDATDPMTPTFKLVSKTLSTDRKALRLVCYCVVN